MPDMQTALKTALTRTLQEWDDDGEIVSPPSPTINTTINFFLGRNLPEGIPCAWRLGKAAHHPQPAYKEKRNES